MPAVRLQSETDFDGWRQAAKALRADGIAPAEVSWSVGADLLGEPPPAASATPVAVPRSFVELADRVTLHRSPKRFDLLYRLFWRLQAEPGLMQAHADPELAAARDMAKAVSRAAHKMKAFVRFRRVDEDGPEAYAAWFEPAHRVTEAVAPFFVRRFANMSWAILTPDVSVAWDRGQLAVLPGVDRSHAPDEDPQEELWRTYYASIFNPARVNPRMMQQEMPKRYWKNLPEARLIPELVAAAGERAARMVAADATPLPGRPLKAAAPHARAELPAIEAPADLAELSAAVQGCRRCPLRRDATCGVPGEGDARAALMLVGEQPGDQEDLQGRPFVGPAGKVLDEALAAAGVARSGVYLTNAVKHFKHEPRGKRRLHKTPGAEEIRACGPWLAAERAMVRPRVLVALGRTAAAAVSGLPAARAPRRGEQVTLEDGATLMATHHPSYVLRLQDGPARARALAELTADLRAAQSRVAKAEPALSG